MRTALCGILCKIFCIRYVCPGFQGGSTLKLYTARINYSAAHVSRFRCGLLCCPCLYALRAPGPALPARRVARVTFVRSPPCSRCPQALRAGLQALQVKGIFPIPSTVNYSIASIKQALLFHDGHFFLLSGSTRYRFSHLFTGPTNILSQNILANIMLVR